MPDEDEGFEPDETAPPGEWLDDLAAASLSAMKAKHEGQRAARARSAGPRTEPAGVTRYTCDRIQMIEALRETVTHQHMTLEALGALADAILARLPEAETPFRNAEISQLRQDIADRDATISMLKDQVTS